MLFDLRATNYFYLIIFKSFICFMKPSLNIYNMNYILISCFICSALCMELFWKWGPSQNVEVGTNRDHLTVIMDLWYNVCNMQIREIMWVILKCVMQSKQTACSGVFRGPLGHGPLWVSCAMGEGRCTWPPFCKILSGEIMGCEILDTPLTDSI